MPICLQAAVSRLDSLVQRHSSPQSTQAPSLAAQMFCSPASRHRRAGSTAGAILAAVAGALPPTEGRNGVEGCEGGCSQAEGEGSLGVAGQTVPAPEACVCGMESSGGGALRSGMQAAGQSHLPFSTPDQALNLMRANTGAVGPCGCFALCRALYLKVVLSTGD